MSQEKEISKWLDEYLKQSELKSFIIGVSGGIDSALTSTLCAITGQKTFVVSLPIHQNANQLKMAKNHIEWLKKKYSNVEELYFDLSKIFDEFKSMFKSSDNLSLANTRSRLRMVTLYHIAATNNGLVVGTGNKIEDFGIGFFTKYGDGGVDISPIADLTKTEVREMSKKLDILPEILSSAPTDGLWDDERTDEDQIGASYEELEEIMFLVEENGFVESEKKLFGRKKEVFNIFKNFNKKNKHKMTKIPFFKKNEIHTN